MNDCTDIEVETHLGALYRFPDMPRSMIKVALEDSDWWKNGSVILVNISGAVINIPARIVKTISFDGKVQSGPHKEGD